MKIYRLLLQSLFALMLCIGAGHANPYLFIGDDQGNLGTVDVTTGSVHVIRNMGHIMTDIAFDPVGNLYGITYTDLYSIDKNTGISTWIGSLGINDANALVFASDGALYTARFTGTQLYTVNKSTGHAKAIGTIGPGFRSSGDLAFNRGNLYLTAMGDQLVKIDLTNPRNSRAIGNMGFHDVYGLATGDDGVLYGIAGTQIVSIDTATGAGTFIYDYRGQGLANTNGSTGTPSLESAPLIIKQADENLTGTGNTILSLCEVAAYADLARQAYEVAGFGKGLWVSLPDSWKLVDSFVDSKLSHGIEIGTGLKAGLFRNPQNDLAIFFAGTEVENSDFISFVKERFPWETLGDYLSTGSQVFALCTVHNTTCNQIIEVMRLIKTGQPLDVWLSALSRVDANVLLNEPALANNVYAIIGFALAGEADVNSDINIAYPELGSRTRAMFENALEKFDEWDNKATNTDQFGLAASGRIVMVGGHSLGGSVAQVVGLSRNVPAITFNSAPVPLDPQYRSEINYDPNRNNILNVRSSDDPLTGAVRNLQSNNKLKSFLTTLIEGIYKLRNCPETKNCLNENLRSRFEAVINDNNFYAGKGNWLVTDAQTGHDITLLAENLKNKNSCAANTSGTVPLDIKATVVKDNTAKQASPKSKSKAPKDSRVVCNKESSVPALNIGGAQGALKKFGSGTDGCAP